MTIRPATFKDLDNILTLNTQIFEDINQSLDNDLVPHFSQTNQGIQYFKEAISNTQGCFFIAEDKDQLIGYTNGTPKDLPYRRSRYFEIENLGVLPQYQNQGIGTKLFNTITQWAKDHHFQKIYILSYAQNHTAINFYQKHGYQIVDLGLEKEI